MIDLHCHLDLYEKPHDVIQKCQTENNYVLSVTTTPSAWKITSSLANDAPRIQTALGLHPQLAQERQGELELFDDILPKANWIGEVGLDGAPKFKNSWKVQHKVFEHILRSCSKIGGRPMSIHSRRSAGDVLTLLSEYPDSGVPVLHWFSGTLRELEVAIDLGCWFSVGLPMLRSKKGRSLIIAMPQDRVLTETDGPFAQVNGRPAYPWDISLTIEELSRTWQVSGNAADEILSENLSRLDNIALNRIKISR